VALLLLLLLLLYLLLQPVEKPGDPAVQLGTMVVQSLVGAETCGGSEKPCQVQ
jgi:hypothetical protein